MIYNHFLLVHKHWRIRSRKGFRSYTGGYGQWGHDKRKQILVQISQCRRNLDRLYSLGGIFWREGQVFTSFLLKTYTGWNTTGLSILSKRILINHSRNSSLFTHNVMVPFSFVAECSSSQLIWCKWQHKWFTGDRNPSPSNFIINFSFLHK